MKQKYKTIIQNVSLGLMLACSPATLADQVAGKAFTLPGTQVSTIHSKSVGIDYLLYVSLPRDYEKQTKTYPVVFLLDANYTFPLYQSIASFTRKTFPARAFFCVGGNESASHGYTEMVGDLQRFVSKFKSKNYSQFRSCLWVAPDEGHHSVFATAAMRGLRWLFSNTKDGGLIEDFSKSKK
jgi:predicted alpha/beta superfamily hydrolase